MVEPPSPSHAPSPRAPPVVVSNSSKCLMASNSEKALAVSNSAKSLGTSNSGKALVMSNSGKALVVSNSGKKIDQVGKKKYVKQVTGRHKDTEIHLAAQRGDIDAVRLILEEIDVQILKASSSGEFNAEAEKLRSAVVNEVNELGETALLIAVEKGHIDVVTELLRYTTMEEMKFKNRSGFDALHIASTAGRQGLGFSFVSFQESTNGTFISD